MELENIVKLIRTVSESAITEFSLEQGETKICLKKDIMIQAAEHLPQVVACPAETLKEVETEAKVIKSPLVGRFYAAPAEGAEAFVSVGDTVKKGQVLAIVEAMKLMNDIESEYDGVVEEVLVKNGEAVEYGQVLFRIV